MLSMTCAVASVMLFCHLRLLIGWLKDLFLQIPIKSLQVIYNEYMFMCFESCKGTLCLLCMALAAFLLVLMHGSDI